MCVCWCYRVDDVTTPGDAHDDAPVSNTGVEYVADDATAYTHIYTYTHVSRCMCDCICMCAVIHVCDVCM